jgi:hypothetical protein
MREKDPDVIAARGLSWKWNSTAKLGAASAARINVFAARVGQPRERRGPSGCYHVHRRSPFWG